MRTEDTTVPEIAAAMDAGHDEMPETREIERLEHFAQTTDDPELKRQLQRSVSSGLTAANTFRKARDRAWMALTMGR